MAEQVREWFDKDGWRLAPAELRAALKVHGASEDVIVELVDEGADRRRAQPVPAAKPETRPVKRHLAPVPDAQANVPPQNLEAEENLLSACMMSVAAIGVCSDVLHQDGRDFYSDKHATIWRAVLALYTDGDPVDAITLTSKLEQDGQLEKVGGKIRTHELAALVPASANAGHYARIVKEAATFRGLIRAGGEITRYGWDRSGEAAEAVDRAQQITFSLGEGSTDDRAEHLHDILKGTFAKISEQYETGATVAGLTTGFRELDELTQGLEPGNLIIIAGRPSMGKSALVHAMLANIAVRQGLPVGIFTLEMSKSEVAKRLLAREAHVNLKHLKGGIQADEWPRIVHAAGVLAKAPIFIDDKGDLRLSNVRSVGRKLKLKHPKLALLVVDFLQLMSSDAENRVQEVSKLSRGLKILARELDLPIIALSQLSRKCEERTNKRPLLSDLRDSGTIEQDADLVAFVYRDEKYNEDTDQRGVAEIIVAKHRNGPTDTIRLAFRAREATFTDLGVA